MFRLCGWPVTGNVTASSDDPVTSAMPVAATVVSAKRFM